MQSLLSMGSRRSQRSGDSKNSRRSPATERITTQALTGRCLCGLGLFTVWLAFERVPGHSATDPLMPFARDCFLFSPIAPYQ